MEKLPTTPSQTIGPFFAYGLTAQQYGYPFTSIANEKINDEEFSEQTIYITGKIVDGQGNTIHDAMIEFWQADENGKYREAGITKLNDGFVGFGRVGTGTSADHSFSFRTCKPKFSNRQAPHVNILLFMRGSLRHLYTRLYFSDEDNNHDPLLNLVDPSRIHTLVARKLEGKKINVYQFDIHMQGEKETVFFSF